MGRYIERFGQLPDAQHFDQAPFVDQAGLAQDVRVDLGRPQALEGGQVDDRVLHSEGVCETLEFRHPLSRAAAGRLRTRASGYSRARRPSCRARPFAALPGDPSAERAGAFWSNREPVLARRFHFRSPVYLAGILDFNQVYDTGHHAADLGRSGRVFVWPMRPRPSARRVPCAWAWPRWPTGLALPGFGCRPSRHLRHHATSAITPPPTAPGGSLRHPGTARKTPLG